jgi:hypothetical protein
MKTNLRYTFLAVVLWIATKFSEQLLITIATFISLIALALWAETAYKKLHIDKTKDL